MADAGSGDRLAEYLRVLGVPNRLALLRALRVPKTVGEIRLPATRRSARGSPDRAITRQGIQRHLKALASLGLVVPRTGERGGRVVTEFALNHARLFLITEDLARLAAIQAAASETATPRLTGRAAERRRPTMRPSFIAANGPLAGSQFPLEGTGPWHLGRGPGVEVSLPFDPFVSARNAMIVRHGRSFELEALPSRNGTQVNWQDLPTGERLRLVSGDAVGVGRSLLFVRGV